LVRVSDPFGPPVDEWLPVSPRLATVRRLILAVVGILAVAAWTVLAAVFAAADVSVAAWVFVILLAVTLVAIVAGLVVIGRVVRAWGYALTDDLLYIRHGRVFRKLVAVPYARLQFVDVTVGPLARAFELATVQLHTASAATDAAIPGLPATRAAELRDTLTTLSEGRYAGL
jgi:membrane protein YdbS with pleckstrin-like domain